MPPAPPLPPPLAAGTSHGNGCNQTGPLPCLHQTQSVVHAPSSSLAALLPVLAGEVGSSLHAALQGCCNPCKGVVLTFWSTLGVSRAPGCLPARRPRDAFRATSCVEAGSAATQGRPGPGKQPCTAEHRGGHPGSWHHLRPGRRCRLPPPCRPPALHYKCPPSGRGAREPGSSPCGAVTSALFSWRAGPLQSSLLVCTARNTPLNEQRWLSVEASDDREKPRWHSPNWAQQGS